MKKPSFSYDASIFESQDVQRDSPDIDGLYFKSEASYWHAVQVQLPCWLELRNSQNSKSGAQGLGISCRYGSGLSCFANFSVRSLVASLS